MAKVELRDKDGGFTDPVTGFDISRDQQKELTEPVGTRTHQALMSGGLLIVGKGRMLGVPKDPAEVGDEDVELAKLNKTELIAEAAKFGITIDPNDKANTKAVIIVAIEAAAAKAEAEAEEEK